MALKSAREQEIQRIHQQYRFEYQIIGGAALVLIGIAIGAVLFTGIRPLINDESGYTANLYTDLLSIGVTVFILDLLARRREEASQLQELQARLLREARSISNEIAKNAIHELRERGWLTSEESLLIGADLSSANLAGADLMNANLRGAHLRLTNLQNADLHDANLQGTFLSNANLQKADLIHTNLRGAQLRLANLQGANLELANLAGAKLHDSNLQAASLRETILRGANLEEANLHRAFLRGADLRGAKLIGVNLQNATFSHVIFSEKTILPDGSNWTEDSDLTRFTNPDHPDFWHPEPDELGFYPWWYEPDNPENT